LIDAGERLPVRLVKENGDTISLDATSIDIVVERMQSNFGIPLFDARKISTDFNQAIVMFEIQGILADDEGQEETAQAVAKIDFDQPQALVSNSKPIGGGGTQGSPVMSSFSTGKPVAGGFIVGGTGNFGGLGGTGGLGGGHTGGGLGGSPSPISPRDLGNRILEHWHNKHISLPVSYWAEKDAKLDNPVTNNLQMWLKADAITTSSGSAISSWQDSSGNGRSPIQSNGANKPFLRLYGANGQPHVMFVGNKVLEYAWDSSNSPFLNPEQMTVFIVASAKSGTNVPIIDSRNGNNGYGVRINNSSDRAQFIHHNTTLDSDAGSIPSLIPKIISATFADTADAGTVADQLSLFVNGDLQGEGSSLTYTPLDQSNQGSFRIGYDGTSYAHANIYEILVYNSALNEEDRELVEGYLSRKYNIGLPENHTYSAGYSRDNKMIKFVFSKDRVGSRKEPYGFSNSTARPTGLKIADGGISGSTYTLDEWSPEYGDDSVPNNAQSWFEVTESTAPIQVKFLYPFGNSNKVRGGNSNPVIGTITAVNNADEVILTLNQSSDPPQVGDKLSLVGDETIEKSTPWKPVIVVPIKNADTLKKLALSDKAVGPDFTKKHEDNATERAGNTITRTDEYIAFLLKNVMTSVFINFGRNYVNDSLGNKISDVFDVTIGTGEQGHQTYLTITQKYASSLGKLENVILTDIPEAKFGFSIEGFTGGKSGKKVKSGGDKAQDLIGILSNSNNFGTNRETASFIEDIHNFGAGAIQAVFYSGNSESRGDYIEGLQIPYSTFSTRGKSNFDTDIAQRNHFLTTADTVSDKYASANSVHASRPFSSIDEGHLRNGIKGMVSDFNVHRDAEMKAYEFSLKFVAADIIL